MTAHPVFLGTPALEVLEGAGVGAVVSPPITHRDGALVGVVSAHHRQATAWTAAQHGTLQTPARAAGLL